MNKLGMSKNIVEFVGKNSQQPPIAHKISGQKGKLYFAFENVREKIQRTKIVFFGTIFMSRYVPPFPGNKDASDSLKYSMKILR